ncbi:MAG: bifunctional riboflavin kinase/FAD synthetase [Campylobacteraceae bacterium]|nr:bifunctional riboflavin kinase/FAD synthetase [Campylobacteraceae bacterium]
MQNSFMHLNAHKVTSLAIGCFDGIHRGHQQLLSRLGKDGAIFVVDKDGANLTPGTKRSEYSKYPCMFYHFLKLKDLTGEEFVELLQKLFPNLKKIVVGYDFKFGANRSCEAKDLHHLFNGEVDIIKEFCFDGISVHSSIIRELLKDGNILQANRLLGREYAIIGDVVTGQGLGKSELYPTINLNVKKYLLPKEGTYATRSKIGDKIYESVSFLGVRKSTDGEFSVETHILNEELNEIPPYIELFFVDFIRENRKFEDLAKLKEAITSDILSAKEALKTCKVYFDSKNECEFNYLDRPV